MDRRFVSDTLKNEELKRTNSKVLLILKQMRQVCKKNNPNIIAKYGKVDSFGSICKQISSGSLTNNAVAKELLRLEKVIDLGRKFEVAHPNGELIHEEIKLSYDARRFLNEINDICVKNYTLKILKKGKENSIEYIFNTIDFYGISSKCILNELVLMGNVKENGNHYELINWKFISEKDHSYFILFTKELSRLLDTVIENINNP